MAQPNFRVQGDDQFIDPKKLRRSIVPLHVEIANVVFSPLGAAICTGMSACIPFFFPATCVPVMFLGLGVLGITAVSPRVRRATLPLRLPLEEAHHQDYNAPTPQHRGFRKAEGTFLLGNTWGTPKEIWAAFGDLLTHCLVLGGTGAGKTEQLLSMAYNGLALGGGEVYVDPKGGPKLYAQHWTMLRLLGRDDDMRVLNLALGADELGKTPILRSNTLQPFAFGKASSLKEIPLSLMAGGGGGSNGNSVFEANGKTLMTALMMMLVDLRNMGETNLSINDIRKYIQPDTFIELAKRKDLSKEAQEAAMSFLTSMGWKPNEKDPAKWGDFSRQYSYAQNYFLDILSTLSDTYRHIFNVPIGDIHMPDIIFQRRCFVAIIPALEKSKPELSTLGKITLMVLRLGVSSGLGDGNVMGSWRKLVDLSLSAARVPAFFFIDEYAAIAVEGFAEVFTQGRGLGISATVGSQDWAGIKKANEAEAQQIVANTKFKFIMTTDDPNDTKQLVESLSGDDLEMQAQSYAIQNAMNYYDTQSATAQRTKRTDQKDFAMQVEGEWHLFYKEKIIRGFGFFAGGVPEDKETPSFVHHLLMVENPSRNALSLRFGDLKNTLDSWKKKIQETKEIPEIPENPEKYRKEMAGYLPLASLFYWVLQHPDAGRRWMEKQRRELACAAVYAWMQQDPFAQSKALLEERKKQQETANNAVPVSSPALAQAAAQVNTENVVVQPDSGQPDTDQPDSGKEKESPEQKDGSSVAPAAQTDPATSVDSIDAEAEDDDPLAAMERKSGLQQAEVETSVEENKTGSPTETQEAAEAAQPSLVPTVSEVPTSNTSAEEEEDSGEEELTALSRALFSALEERIESQAQTYQDVGRVLGAKEEELEDLPKRMVAQVRESMKKPPYPVPPKPENKTASDLRPLAERWVQRIKGN